MLVNELENNRDTDEEHWIAVSDLMSGLMMVFMLIAITYLVILERKNREVQQEVILYEDLRDALYADLDREFSADMQRWGSELGTDLAFRFTNTDLLFEEGESDLKPDFVTILQDFFPRYLRILNSEKYREDVSEIRIEGHTSSSWGEARNSDDAYMRNMALSQERTRSTLGFILDLDSVVDQKDWLREHLTANGLSSSKLIIDGSGNEDPQRSRRVEFIVKTDAEARIASILRDIN
jgi:outer membrane protein OmpA-like peptidoglycan-associated protein